MEVNKNCRLNDLLYGSLNEIHPLIQQKTTYTQLKNKNGLNVRDKHVRELSSQHAFQHKRFEMRLLLRHLIMTMNFLLIKMC